MASCRINVTIPEELLREIDVAADVEHRTRSELIREATRRYLLEGVWKRLQLVGAERAERLGIKTEADVERLIDEYRAERRGQ